VFFYSFLVKRYSFLSSVTTRLLNLLSTLQLMPSASQYFKEHKDLKSKVFIGVGSYEKDVVRNIDSFKNYLASRQCPDLKISADITPGANHGAALAQVMQNAIAYGYCERHQAITVDPAIFN
jgi:hypothetical protein